ncbi:hypothetical protein MNBD_GAMMA15-452 [hydrothermal vent metagenome]|uniref:LysM domain-containing protein n=1 Tax=hydrothermal vent metagenome TaxID=652676 RepID=A0A3B0YIL7_9ZZZZ
MVQARMHPRTGILFIFLLVSACASTPEKHQPLDPFETVEQSSDGSSEKRRYIILDTKRYISGPYGEEQEVLALITTIKNSSKPSAISNRAVNLPNKPANLSLTVYDYDAPGECGGHTFRVYEGDELQILEFDFPENNKITRIRDYTRGPTPFVSAGLWGPYDHTEGTAVEMCLLAGEGRKDGMGLMESRYVIGWITNIVDWKQAELGAEYASAVSNTNNCLRGQASLAEASVRPQKSKAMTPKSGGTYQVRAGDTLGSIARDVYGDFGRWIELYTANSVSIGENPNKLPADIILKLP